MGQKLYEKIDRTN